MGGNITCGPYCALKKATEDIIEGKKFDMTGLTLLLPRVIRSPISPATSPEILHHTL